MSDFSLTLIRWFRENGRDLPWRHTRDPYAIWLSEIILQQTQVKQGWDYWERFMRRWPKVEDLAAASEDEVLREWQGLGYYSRARNLHYAARQIVGLGHFPDTLEEIKALKGVGDYSSTYNQAIMDFGAIQCTPALPNCVKCPLIETCEAFRSASVNQLPVKLKTIKVRERHLTYLYIRWQGKVAIHRRGVGDIWQGLWEPLVQETKKEVDIKGKVTVLKRAVKHVLTHQVLLADFLLLEPEVLPQLPVDYQWVPEESLDDYAVPRLVEHLFEAVRINDEKSY